MKNNTQPLLPQLFNIYCYVNQVKEVCFGEIGVLLEQAGGSIDYITLSNGLDVLVVTGIFEKNETAYRAVIQNDSFDHFCHRIIEGMRLNDSKLIIDTFSVEGIKSIGKDKSIYFWRAFINPNNRYLLPYLDNLGLVSFINEGRVVFIPSGSIISQLIIENIHKSSKKRKSIETLLSELESKRKLGELGESIAFAYELKRLMQLGHAEKPELVSNDYVNAGYDLQSYMKKESQEYDRFIEVKALTPGRGFYLSRNELEKAKELRCLYFLYLVDISKSTFANPIVNVICNPASVLFKESTDWKISIESYYIEPLIVDDDYL